MAQAFRLAWDGADPGETEHASRPAETEPLGVPVALPVDGDGAGSLLALSLAADRDRVAGGVRLRRVPSAGGRYPVDAAVGGLRYDPVGHALDGAPPDPGVPVVLTLDPARTVWRYGPRSLPVLLLDLGHAAAAVLAASAVLARPRVARLAGGPAGPTIECRPESGRGPRMRPSAPGADAPGGTGGPGSGVVEGGLAACVTGGHDLGGAPAVRPSAADLLRRRSAPWAELTGPIPPVDAVLAAAERRLGPGQTAVVLGRSHPLLAALAGRACGQPATGSSAALLVVAGDVEPGPGTAVQYVRAGLAAHDAWLVATAAGIPARPVGCWIDAVLRRADGGPGARVQHALALGSVPR
ncbi:hypothetical protein [Pseudonocardia phyllosphaerae]|uniref:hypothetical protein n=1 Tax=Pseudonocardia phyllosphaerae TaxID=3390502 RepID=UPI00397E1C41